MQFPLEWYRKRNANELSFRHSVNLASQLETHPSQRQGAPSVQPGQFHFQSASFRAVTFLAVLWIPIKPPLFFFISCFPKGLSWWRSAWLMVWKNEYLKVFVYYPLLDSWDIRILLLYKFSDPRILCKITKMMRKPCSKMLREGPSIEEMIQ